MKRILSYLLGLLFITVVAASNVPKRKLSEPQSNSCTTSSPKAASPVH